MADDMFRTITKILRDRDLQFDHALLKSALTDSDTRVAISNWVDDHLSPETLLTKDEVNLFTTLTQTGEAETLSKNDLSLILDLNSHELQTAIEKLRESTASIEKQIEALRLQQNALSAIRKNEKRARQTRFKAEKIQVRKWEAEKSSIAAKISEKVQSLIYQKSDLTQYLKSSDHSLKQAIESIFRSDDKLLSSFQKLASELDTSLPENNHTVERIKDLCARYIKYTVEGVRTRLDRIYLESLQNFSNGKVTKGDDREVNEMQEELESLYTEILPVAQISVEQQYIEPALRMTNSNAKICQDRLSKSLEYIENGLIFLTKRIETYLERAKEVQCHRMTIEAVLKTVNEELTNEEQDFAHKSSSFLDEKIRPSPEQDYTEIEPEQELAQTLGITLPERDKPGEAAVIMMEKLLSERRARLDEQDSDLQLTMESSISSHLSDAHVTLSLLRDTLLSNSKYHSVKLIDPKLEYTVDNLEKEISQEQTRLEAIDIHDLESRNTQRNHFLSRCSKY